MRSSIGLALVVVVGIAAAVASCSPKNAGHGGGGNGGNGDGGLGGGNGDGGVGPGGCVGLQCQQMSCPGGGTTTLTGKVYAPNGTLPLYNAIVYVPNSTPAPFPEGVTCDRCNGNVSGDPVVQTLTDATGSFTLTNVPVGANIPLVIQLGKWRRQTVIPSVPGCTSTPLDAGLTTLPKNRTEGDIPRMAIVTGSADPFECLLLKMGIDASEITEPSNADSRIHLYQSANNKPGGIISASTPKGTQLYDDLATLEKYDVVLLPCEGSAFNQSDTGRQNIGKYLDAGGRVFTTHYSYDWWHYSGSPFEAVATWMPGQADQYNNGGIIGVLNTNFPKGMAFAQWLIAAQVSAESPMGKLKIIQDRHDVTAIKGTTQDWVNYDYGAIPKGGNGVEHLTFNTPLNAPSDDMGVPQYCGRAVFSDFHVTADTLKMGAPSQGWSFPSDCDTSKMIDQEKALIFMLFDLSSCVQSDTMPPIP